MTLVEYKFIAGILIFVISLLAVIYPIKIRAYPSHHPLLELADAFASGIFLGAALFHMLPDAIIGFEQQLGDLHYPLAELFCAGGFLLLLFLERLSHCTSFKKSVDYLPYMLTFILIIHSLIEGAALGINTTIATASVIFLAVIAHKSSESFALAVILNRSQLKLLNIIVIVGLFSLMTPLGVALGAYSTTFLKWNTGQLLTAGFNAFAAGTFLYMSTLHHVNHHHSNDSENLWEFAALVVGLCIMALLAWWA